MPMIVTSQVPGLTLYTSYCDLHRDQMCGEMPPRWEDLTMPLVEWWAHMEGLAKQAPFTASDGDA